MLRSQLRADPTTANVDPTMGFGAIVVRSQFDMSRNDQTRRNLDKIDSASIVVNVGATCLSICTQDVSRWARRAVTI
jgi:hypothetical protein